MKRVVILLLLTSTAVGQTLTLGDIKLTLGMSETEVFNQFAYVSNYGGRTSIYVSANDMPDGELVLLSRVRPPDMESNCVHVNHHDCFAVVAFSHSRLTYASKSTYSGGSVASDTLSELIGSLLSTSQLAAGQSKTCSIEYSTRHLEGGAKEAIVVT